MAKKMKRNLSYFSRTINDKKVELEQVAARLREAGFAAHRVSCQIRARRKALSAELVDAVRDELAEALEAYREPRERSPVARYPPASAPAIPAVRRRVCRST